MRAFEIYASEFADLVQRAKSLPLGGYPPLPRIPKRSDAPKALFFSPHPDDECISSGIAVRLMRETGMDVLNVAVTQGSNKARQPERLQELKAACDYIGFGLLTTGPNGLENINPKTRENDPSHWADCVTTILGILQGHLPRVIMFPHAGDWNSTHIGTHFLVLDALRQMTPEFACYLVETEFWGQMSDPNLMVEISAKHLAEMITGTSFHVGEVKRNPYHLLLPAWMLDNVRRGTELVGGQGGAAPGFTFAALYRLRKWRQGRIENVFDSGRQISRSSNIGELFS
jgi:LmbE family N-acetylglucosaminyl deacetylase